jgi:hypothetical protein
VNTVNLAITVDAVAGDSVGSFDSRRSHQQPAALVVTAGP